jgi:hypothetical protein
MQQDEKEDKRQTMRWLDDVSMELRKMDVNEWKDRARNREALESYCRGGQGPLRAVAASGRKKFVKTWF